MCVVIEQGKQCKLKNIKEKYFYDLGGETLVMNMWPREVIEPIPGNIQGHVG